MSTWYSVSRPFAEVNFVEVTGETSHTITVGGRRVKKNGEWRSYFKTFDEAKSHLLETASRRVGSAKDQLKYAEEFLAKATAITEPTKGL